MLDFVRSFATEYYYEYDTLVEDMGTDAGLTAGVIITYLLVVGVVLVIMLAAMWKVFQKAGRPGWAAIIPIYNTYVMLKIVGRPGWWLLLYFIPIVNIFVAIVVTYELAKAFGKDVGYTLLLLFLPVIGWPMLAWGSAKYKKPKQR